MDMLQEKPRTDKKFSESAIPSGSGISHTISTDFESLVELQPAWDRLVEKVHSDIYSTYDWCAVWWRHYGWNRCLQIHLFHEVGQLIAVLPLFREKLRLGPSKLNAIRLVGCDHSVTTCSPTIRSDRIAIVIRMLMDSIDDQPTWDMVHFGPLPGYYEYGKVLEEALHCSPSVGAVHSNEDGGPHILFDLPDSYQTYIGSLPSHERHNIRKREKRFAADYQREVRVVPDGDVEREFSAFVEQHQTQWQALHQLGHFRDWPHAEAYHRDLVSAQAKRGRCLLLRLDGSGDCVGYQYNYRFGQRIHWILGSRSMDSRWEPYSPGRMVFCATAAHGIATGAVQIDALRGYYEYKLRLGGSVSNLQSVCGIRRSKWSQFRFAFCRACSKWFDLVYYRIWFNRVAPRWKILQRPLWSSWIRSRI